jgi:hypothetical protein
MNKRSKSLLQQFIREYSANAQEGFESRWSQVKPNIYKRHMHEAIGGLLARQATLSIEMVKSPYMWNGHIAPIVLRSMVDGYITLGWILKEPEERSKKYILYGLGQEKLFVEYLEQDLSEDEDSREQNAMREMVKARKAWLNSQLAEWATEVNVGSWSGMTTREMAQDIERESIYKFAYMPFSGPAHNMWQHVGIYNMKPCTNPMHKHHFVPSIRKAPFEPDFMYRSAKYLTLSYTLFDSKMHVTSNVPLPMDFFIGHKLFNDPERRKKPGPRKK